jgi:hypothetical protein
LKIICSFVLVAYLCIINKILKRSKMLKMTFNNPNAQNTWDGGVLRAFIP